jgi:isopropylmalate/homocitrate/citramalate synthase
MKILISNRQLLQATWPDAINYFLSESITAEAESIVDFAESIVDFAESITAEAESIVAVAVESTVVAVSAALLQAAKVAAIANTNNTFFIFLIFNCYLNINTEC